MVGQQSYGQDVHHQLIFEQLLIDLVEATDVEDSNVIDEHPNIQVLYSVEYSFVELLRRPCCEITADYEGFDRRVDFSEDLVDSL